MTENNWSEIYKQYNFIKNQNSNDIRSFMIHNINSSDGWFLNRLGGSDFDAVTEYFNVEKNSNLYNFSLYIQNTKELNGYFDKSTDEIIIKQNFIIYLEKMYNCYINSHSFTNAMGTIQKYFRHTRNIFNKTICGDKTLIHYYYIEGIMDFLNDFKIFAENKKILIISPFSESIKYQSQLTRINNLINNYIFPNCTFLTYNTPITYNNANDNLDEVVCENWLEQCTNMEKEIEILDFDIALLSCASYANCLGSFIANKMNKKSIYIGGVLNVLFNIYGSRYDDDFYNSINNLEYRIKAIESSKYSNIKGGRKFKNEALRAYF